MKVSFIIPVYNVECYLEECIDSILKQSYKSIEVILVDDGSSDNSPIICDRYAKEDNRVRVIHQPNGGQSDARNKGVSLASGEYIIFVDSDDFWIGEDSLQKIMDIVHENGDCDFVGFNCSYYYTDTNSYRNWVAHSEKTCQPIAGDLVVPLLVESGTFPMSPCLKVISREFYKKINLYFKVGTLAEDIPWFIDMLEGARKCVFTNMYIYAYRQNVIGSVTRSNVERVYSNLFNIIKDELKCLRTRAFSDESKEAIYSFFAYEFCILLSLVPKLSNPSIRRGELYELRWLLSYTLNPKVKLVSRVYKLFGLRITEIFLNSYNTIRKFKK